MAIIRGVYSAVCTHSRSPSLSSYLWLSFCSTARAKQNQSNRMQLQVGSVRPRERDTIETRRDNEEEEQKLNAGTSAATTWVVEGEGSGFYYPHQATFRGAIAIENDTFTAVARLSSLLFCSASTGQSKISHAEGSHIGEVHKSSQTPMSRTISPIEKKETILLCVKKTNIATTNTGRGIRRMDLHKFPMVCVYPRIIKCTTNCDFRLEPRATSNQKQPELAPNQAGARRDFRIHDYIQHRRRRRGCRRLRSPSRHTPREYNMSNCFIIISYIAHR